MQHTAITSVDTDSRVSLGIMSGDRVRVTQRIPEKDGKFRFQDFEGVVIARKHKNEAGGTFTVRASVEGIGVERIFPLFSPMIDKIEIIRRSKVRRAKLYFLRNKTVKGIREKLRKTNEVNATTVSESQRAKEKEQSKKEEQERSEQVQKEEEKEVQKEETQTETHQEVQTEKEQGEKEKPAENEKPSNA